MITAAEARKLRPRTVQDMVNDIGKEIEKRAKMGATELRTGWDYKFDPDLWQTGGYNLTEDWMKARKILEEHGFEVSFYYKDGSQFSDFYTLIKW